MTLPDDVQGYERKRLSQHAVSEANWFFLIVALSLVNEVVPRLGMPVYFVAGLATTWLAAAFAHSHSSALGSHVQAAGYALAAVPLLVFIVLGLLARNRYLWAYFAGIVLYAADGAVFLLYYRDYFSAGFHVFILYFLVSGVVAALSARSLRAGALAEPEPVAEPPVDDKPSSNSLYPH